MSLPSVDSLPPENTRPIPAKALSSGPFYWGNRLINAFAINHDPPPATALSVRLVSVGISHYCEKVRWALDLISNDAAESLTSSSHPAVNYVEDAHPPGLASFATLALDPTVSAAPVVLVRDVVKGREFVLSDSTRILQQLTPFLYSAPQRGENENEVELWEEDFDRRLGATARCWVYHILLDPKQRSVLVKMATKDTSPIESVVFRALVSRGLSGSMRKLMKIDAASAAISISEIKSVFADVGVQLSREKAEGGSGNFLVHDRFTAADLTFAALASPVLLPPELAHTYPKIEELPEETQRVILELRETAAGKYALNTYQKFRFAKHLDISASGAARDLKVKPVEGTKRNIVQYRSLGLSRTRKLPMLALGAAIAAGCFVSEKVKF